MQCNVYPFKPSLPESPRYQFNYGWFKIQKGLIDFTLVNTKNVHIRTMRVLPRPEADMGLQQMHTQNQAFHQMSA